MRYVCQEVERKGGCSLSLLFNYPYVYTWTTLSRVNLVLKSDFYGWHEVTRSIATPLKGLLGPSQSSPRHFCWVARGRNCENVFHSCTWHANALPSLETPAFQPLSEESTRLSSEPTSASEAKGCTQRVTWQSVALQGHLGTRLPTLQSLIHTRLLFV